MEEKVAKIQRKIIRSNYKHIETKYISNWGRIEGGI